MLSVRTYSGAKFTGRVPGGTSARGPLIPFMLVTALFFLWGIPNNLNDVLIRQFMKSFAISRLQAGLVQSAFYMGYFLLALPSALYMRKVGYKGGFITGLLLFGGGTLLFWPAAIVGRYSFFLSHYSSWRVVSPFLRQRPIHSSRSPVPPKRRSGA